MGRLYCNTDLTDSPSFTRLFPWARLHCEKTLIRLSPSTRRKTSAIWPGGQRSEPSLVMWNGTVGREVGDGGGGWLVGCWGCCCVRGSVLLCFPVCLLLIAHSRLTAHRNLVKGGRRGWWGWAETRYNTGARPHTQMQTHRHPHANRARRNRQMCIMCLTTFSSNVFFFNLV